MAVSKPTLAELQDMIAKGILNGDDGALARLRTPPMDTKDVMFGVYRKAYLLRLTEFLRNDYPRLHAYAGDDALGAISKDYAKAHPSDSPNARWYSRHVPEFLKSHAPWNEHPELADLAAIERALTDSFDAEDAPVFTLGDLQQVAPEDFEEARLSFHPSVRLIAVSTNAYPIWSALKAEEAPPAAARLEAPETVLVWREGGTSMLRALSSEEHMALNGAMEGLSFAVICEMIAVMGEPDTAAIRAATYLRQWIEGELVSGLAAA